MKIIQLIYSLGNGGAEKFVVELSNELAKNNEVILCSVKKIEDWMVPAKNIRGNVKTTIMGFNKKYSFKLLYLFFSFLKNNKPDVVHIHSSLMVFYFFLISIFYKNIRFTAKEIAGDDADQSRSEALSSDSPADGVCD